MENALGSPPLSLGIHYGLPWDKLFTRREIDEFILLYERSSTSEHELHAYLKDHPKFLFALGAYEAAVSEVTIPSKSNSVDGDRLSLRLDFMLKDRSGLWDVIELKKADFGDVALVVGQPERRRFSAKVEDGIAQVKTYLRQLDASDVQAALAQRDIWVYEPQAWLIVGRDKYLSSRERRLLERDLPHYLRIVTYDDLCALAKQRAVIVSSTTLLPYIASPLSLGSELIKPDLVAGSAPTNMASPIEPRRFDVFLSHTHKDELTPDVIQNFVRRLRLDLRALATKNRKERVASKPSYPKSVFQSARPRTPIRPFMGKLKMP
jgi:hypothetical protein